MTRPRYSELATELLAREARRDTDEAVDPLDRAHAIDAIGRALAAKARRRARTRWVLAFSAAAGVAAALGMARWTLGPHAGRDARVATDEAKTEADRGALALAIVGHADGVGPGGVTVTLSGETSALSDSRRLAPGSRILASTGAHATLAFSTGTQIAVLADADFTIVREDATQEFQLSHGAIRAMVAKLGSAQRFIVRTPDAEVEVRGTAFRVGVAPSDPGCGAGTVTRVEVSEGVVVVRRGMSEARVAKGEVWPEGCAHAAPHVDAPRVGAPPSWDPVPNEALPGAGPQVAIESRSAVHPSISPLPKGSDARGTAAFRAAAAPQATASSVSVPVAAPQVASRLTARSAVSNASSLAAQNELFADAVAAKRDGMTAQAVAGFDRLLATYPASPLAESASVERLRLLRGRDPARATTAAREYLARFTDGFARTEAEAILAERP